MFVVRRSAYFFNYYFWKPDFVLPHLYRPEHHEGLLPPPGREREQEAEQGRQAQAAEHHRLAAKLRERGN